MRGLKAYFFGPTFLTGRRLDDYPRLIVLVLLFGPLIGKLVLGRIEGVSRLLSDFSPMYAGGLLAVRGEAVSAYRYGPLNAAIAEVFPGYDGGYVWLFPPTFFMPTQLLAHLPHDAAFMLWQSLTAVVLIGCLRGLVSSRRQAWLLATFPAVFVNAWVGQNGFLVAALYAAVAVWMTRRPAAAALALAALTFKPQFGILLPPLLLVRRRWQVFAFTSILVLALIGGTALLYGADAWRVFLESTPGALGDLTVGGFPIDRHTTTFAALVRLGVSREIAMPIQIALALGVLAVVLVASVRATDWPLIVSTTVAGTFVASPYVFPYDWAALLMPLAVLTSRRVAGGWRPGERPTLGALWAGAALSGFFPQAVFASLAVLPLMAFFVVMARCCLSEGGAGAAIAPRGTDPAV